MNEARPSKEKWWITSNPHHYGHPQMIPKIIKYRFIWGIINKQNVPNMGVGKFQEKKIKVFMEIGFSR
jgi:hypothetical protein